MSGLGHNGPGASWRLSRENISTTVTLEKCYILQKTLNASFIKNRFDVSSGSSGAYYQYELQAPWIAWSIWYFSFLLYINLVYFKQRNLLTMTSALKLQNKSTAANQCIYLLVLFFLQSTYLYATVWCFKCVFILDFVIRVIWIFSLLRAIRCVRTVWLFLHI